MEYSHDTAKGVAAPAHTKTDHRWVRWYHTKWQKIVSQQFFTLMTSQHFATQMAPILKPARFGCCSSLHYTLVSTANHLTHTRDNWEGRRVFFLRNFPKELSLGGQEEGKENPQTTMNRGNIRENVSVKLRMYRLTSYVSTRAMKPLGKAIAKLTIAASSPSLASAVLIPKTFVNLRRCSTASSNIFPEHPG